MARSLNLARFRTVLAVALFSLFLAPLLKAQSSADSRSKVIDRILADYNQALLQRDPLAAQAASSYPDQLPDLSVAAENAWQERQQTFIQRLSEVDLAGLPDPARRSAENLLNTLIEAQSSKHVRQWQMPLDQFNHLHARMIALAQTSSFSTAKDYDDYLARLRKLPAAFSQVMTNLQLAREQGRFAPGAQREDAQQAVQTVATSPGEASPFAAPLKRFPSAIPAELRKRIASETLDTIANEVLPAYSRVGRFIAAMPIPAEPVSAQTNERVPPR